MFTSRLIHFPHPKSGSPRGRGTLRCDQVISHQAVINPPSGFRRQLSDLTRIFINPPSGFRRQLIHYCPHPKSLSQRGRGTLRGDQMISQQAVINPPPPPIINN
ncbi:hypothetical protein B9S53_26565 [Arthrospira sp. O9.13F]|nr:hypothetical protein B9S53_26565 [Arthrospira sp. O9.13F]